MKRMKLVLENGPYRLWELTGDFYLDLGFDAPVRIAKPDDIDYDGLRKVIYYSMESLNKSTLSFVLSHVSTIRMAYRLRHLTRSSNSLLVYSRVIKRLCNELHMSPDELIRSCLSKRGRPNNQKIEKMAKEITKVLMKWMDKGDLAHSTVTIYACNIESFFRWNEIKISLKDRLPRAKMRNIYAPDAPTSEEVKRMIDLAPTVRDKAIIAMLATSGLRIGTLMKLRYKDVMKDLEDNRIPVMIRVPAELTKGKYASYTTFINEEAAYYLKIYLDERRRGTEKIPPQTVTRESPLFVTYRNPPKPLTPDSFRRVFDGILRKMGVEKRGRRKRLTIHSLRKYFKTRMLSKNINESVIDYMLGHVRDTYTKIQSMGLDWLRNQYISGEPRIEERRVMDKEKLKQMLRSMVEDAGYKPDEFLKPGAGLIIGEALAKILGLRENRKTGLNRDSRIEISTLFEKDSLKN